MRAYHHSPTGGNPSRNLASDIIHQALCDIQPPEELTRIAGRSNAYAKELLSLHNKALYFFRNNHHKYLCESLDMDPGRVKEVALTGKVKEN